jgi:signal peptidase
MKTAMRTIRRLPDILLVLFVAAVLALAVAANAGPALGHRLLVIRGGSMEPAIPLGALVDIVPAPVERLHSGDVVSIQAPNGVVITHRVTRVVHLSDGWYVEVKGDANAEPDPVLIPSAWVMGRADLALPVIGYFFYLLTIPAGIVSFFSLAAVLLLVNWLLEDLREGEDEELDLGGEGGLAHRAGEPAG